MFQQQKLKVISDQLLSPRCLKQKKEKSNGQFYSWKNHLNQQIHRLYNKIKNPQKETKNQVAQVPKQFKKQQKNMNKIHDQLQSPLSNIKQNHENRNSYSRAQVGTNTPYKNYLSHRSTKSVATGQTSAFKEDKNTLNIFQPSFIFKNVEIKSQKINKEKSCNQSNQRAQVRQKTQKQIIQFSDKLNEFIQQRNQRKINEQKLEDKFNQYHLQLKQAERLYLLKKFMQHYQNIHNLTL